MIQVSKKKFIIVTSIISIIISFFTLWIFGYLFSDYFDALNNNYIFIVDDKCIPMTLKQKNFACFIVIIQRFILYFLPGLLVFIGWIIFQKIKKRKIKKIKIRVFCLIQTIVFITYSIISCIIYIFAIEYFFDIKNPFSNVDFPIFAIGIILGFVLKDDLIHFKDEEVANSFFKK